MGLKKDLKRPGNLLPLERYRGAELLVAMDIPAKSGFFDVAAPPMAEPEQVPEQVFTSALHSLVEEPPSPPVEIPEPILHTPQVPAEVPVEAPVEAPVEVPVEVPVVPVEEPIETTAAPEEPSKTLEQLAYDDLVDSEKAIVEAYLRQIGQLE
jgi:outer membrane biosynthesis protein TonB